MGLKDWFHAKGNKRIFLRLLTPSLMSYCGISASPDDKGPRLANVKDVSEGGLMFIAYEMIPVSSTLKVSFKLPGRELPIECYAKVSRTTKVSESAEIYHVGVNFLDITIEDRADIAGYVSHLSRSPIGKELVLQPRWWKFWKRRKTKKINKLKGVFYSHEDTEKS